LALSVIGILIGCEAPLNLEGVEKERQNLTHRFDQFQAVAASDTHVAMVGAAGAMMTSIDNGQTWQRITLDGEPSLIDVAACGDGHFAALTIDRKVWISNAAVQEWTVIDIPTMEEVLALECRDDNSYWVVGSFSTILSSTDGGANWHENSLGEDAQFTTIQFINNDLGYAGGEFGIFIKTEDGGATWNNIEMIPGEFYPQDSYFKNESEGWAVGLNGGIFYTNDGGTSWQTQDSGTRIPLYGVAGNEDRLYVVGEAGVVLQYSEEQWQPMSYDGSVLAYLRGVTVAGSNVVIAGGNGANLVLPVN
jgi:photosystem II stability/assembly factor-like uncharacterized protein